MDMAALFGTFWPTTRPTVFQTLMAGQSRVEVGFLKGPGNKKSRTSGGCSLWDYIGARGLCFQPSEPDWDVYAQVLLTPAQPPHCHEDHNIFLE